MRIAFNGVGCGWGNNGGTQSIFRMAAALTKLGHEVELWSDIPNKFTWFEPEANVRVIHKAIGAKEGVVKLYRASTPLGHSIYDSKALAIGE